MIKARQHVSLLGCIIGIMMLVWGCAKQGYPSGGPKDEDPPVVVYTEPANGTVWFDRQTFIIKFDEYVTLKDATNNVLVSPTMKESPDFSVKGKQVIVKIKDTLKPNTTYLFQFKDAIADYHEGNLLGDYDYVFATGGWIDSCCIKGRVVDALTLAARAERVTLLAYREPIADSLSEAPAVKATPTYVRRADKEGSFCFNHIATGRYRLIAIEDGNQNFRLDEGEAVGFLSESVEAVVAVSRGNDRDTCLDSIPVVPDSMPVVLIRMYEPGPQTQRVRSADRVDAGLVRIVTQLPLLHPSITLADGVARLSLNQQRDTLQVWVANPTADSLRLILVDSSGLNDTLRIGKKKTSKLGGATGAVKPLFGNKLPYWEPARLAFVNPMKTREPVDTLWNVITGLTADSVIIDSVGLRIDSIGLQAEVLFGNEWRFRPGVPYHFTLHAGSLEDIYGVKNEVLDFTITVTDQKDYGLFRLSLLMADSVPATYYLLQLVDEANRVVSQQVADSSQTIVFPHLNAGTLRLRAVIDANRNDRWDEGNYRAGLQPESVLYYEKTLTIRPNWELEERWLLPER